MTVLRREFKVEVNQGQPQVEYKEALTMLQITEKFTRNKLVVVVNLQILYLLSNQRKKVKLGLEFVNVIKGGNVPKEYVPSVEKGFKDSMKNGPLAGFEVDAMKDYFERWFFPPSGFRFPIF